MPPKIVIRTFIPLLALLSSPACDHKPDGRTFNAPYEGEYLSQIAFPIGGMGAGMFCIEGNGTISHMSIHHVPELFNEPLMFAVLHVKGQENGSKVIEGNVPEWKKYGRQGATLGISNPAWGFPRFDRVRFTARFPFAHIELTDDDMPLDAEITAWSPFIPTNEDDSGLPAGTLEYRFTNHSAKEVEAVFSYNSNNFAHRNHQVQGAIEPIGNGFILTQRPGNQPRYEHRQFAIFTDDTTTIVNHSWFRGQWWDPVTMAWNDIEQGTLRENSPKEGAPGASLYIPFTLEPGESRTIRLHMVWYVPYSGINYGPDAETDADRGVKYNPAQYENYPAFYEPWYGHRFPDIRAVCDYWLNNYGRLKRETESFTEAFYSSTLPPEVIEAVAANLTILKSPTVWRQHDGRMWNWEGCGDTWGSCHGSCTHVWNYAQALPHLFPAMERTLRETEFRVGQNSEGHQVFRNNLPIRPTRHDFHAAADGQLGGILKAYRDWRISGDQKWIAELYPLLVQSLEYCIRTWDPRETGALEEPHHNTYDIEFWGPDGMCSSIYAEALNALSKIGKALGHDTSRYDTLLAKSVHYLEERLFNGEYFAQQVMWRELNAPDPTQAMTFHSTYSEEAREILDVEGPKYQYGNGCLSDGVIGDWMAWAAGLDGVLDPEKVRSHLCAVHKYNLRHDLYDHANPQRTTYALGRDGGLLLCSWPKGGKPQLPFVYSNEVWSGIEYQVAAHLIAEGEVEKGLEIVRTCRNRYDGRVRNPFNEYECGSWYARALSSYSLLQALTGVRYDAVDRTLHIAPRIEGDFITFLSTATGFGTVAVVGGRPEVNVVYGRIDIDKIQYE